MELPSYKQKDIDNFFNNTLKMDSTILIDIYQDMQAPGWYDKGGFEFLITLWNVNSKLSKNERTKIIIADYQIPIRQIKTREEFQKKYLSSPSRNSYMASLIEKTINKSKDLRNNLFIVGYGIAHLAMR